MQFIVARACASQCTNEYSFVLRVSFQLLTQLDLARMDRFFASLIFAWLSMSIQLDGTIAARGMKIIILLKS